MERASGVLSTPELYTAGNPRGMRGAFLGKTARERRGITADTALRLSRFFNTSYQFWMNLHCKYDLHCAEDAAGRSIARIKPFATSTDVERAT